MSKKKNFKKFEFQTFPRISPEFPISKSEFQKPNQSHWFIQTDWSLVFSLLKPARLFELTQIRSLHLDFK